jgi:HEAT repeat protein
VEVTYSWADAGSRSLAMRGVTIGALLTSAIAIDVPGWLLVGIAIICVIDMRLFVLAVTVRHVSLLSADQVREPHVADSLTTAMRRGDYYTLHAAALAMAALGDAAIVPLVEGLSADRGAQRRGAAWALRFAPSPGAVQPLAEALHDADAQVRCSAAWALGSIADARAAGPLLDALGDPDGEVRHAVAAALGRIRAPQATSPLTHALGDESERARFAAGWALRALRSTRALDSAPR